MSFLTRISLLLSLLPSQLYAAPSENILSSSGKTLEQYAAAAYCNNDFAARRGTKVVCNSGNCPKVENAQTVTTFAFSETPNTDTNGFVAIDQTNHYIVVAFRGVETFTNILNLLNISPSDNGLCSDCKVVAGLYNFWKDVHRPVEVEVRRAQAQFPTYRTIAVGHSLGGAIASYAAAELRASGIATDLVTFGAPRVGNDAYVQTLMAQAPAYGRNYRFVHKGDPIPSIPWASMGYRHPGPEYVINSDTAQGVTPADIEVRPTDDEDGDSTPGLLENALQDSWKAHTWYFNAVTVCYDGGSLSNYFTPFKNEPEFDDSTNSEEESREQRQPTTIVVEVEGDDEERKRLAAKKWVKNMELNDGEDEDEVEDEENDEDKE